jgi:hypothetical protein
MTLETLPQAPEKAEPECILLRFNFFSDVTEVSYIDILMKKSIIDSGPRPLENACANILKSKVDYKMLIPYDVKVIDTNPEYLPYHQLLKECFFRFEVIMYKDKEATDKADTKEADRAAKKAALAEAKKARDEEALLNAQTEVTPKIEVTPVVEEIKKVEDVIQSTQENIALPVVDENVKTFTINILDHRHDELASSFNTESTTTTIEPVVALNDEINDLQKTA